MARTKINAPLKLSEEMSIYMGKSKASRGEVIAKIWKDIKRVPGYQGMPAELPEALQIIFNTKKIHKVHEVTKLLSKVGAFES